MTKQTLRILFFLIVTLVLISCQTKKKYYYVEDNKDEKLIEAYSDSVAYLEAYKDFVISKKFIMICKQHLVILIYLLLLVLNY